MTKKLRYYHAILALIVVYFLAVGIKGINYGKHWDENKLLLTASMSMKEGKVLPGWYNYPSLPYDITLAVCQGFKIQSQLNPDAPNASQLEFAKATRITFLIFSSLSLIFIWLITRDLSGSPPLSLLAAALAATNWQFGYHSRYVAPDTLMTAFALGAIWHSIRFLQNQSLKSLVWASILAGLALGSKYPAGLAILPVLLSGLYVVQSGQKKWITTLLVKRWALAIGILFGVFFLTSPGILLQFNQFRADLAYEITHYATGHRGHNIAPWTVHPFQILQYIANRGFSEISWLSLIVTCFAIPGIVSIWRKNQKMAIVFLSFPLLYFLYFSNQRVMIVRNYMLLIPIIQILAVCGAIWMADLVKKRFKTPLLYTSIALIPAICLIPNIPDVWQKAGTIVIDTDEANLASPLEHYLQSQPDLKVYFSPMVKIYWKKEPRFRDPAPVFKGDQLPLPEDSYLVFFSLEPTNLLDVYEANHSDYVREIWGPMAADFRYYPFWLSNYLVIMPAKYAKDLKFREY